MTTSKLAGVTAPASAARRPRRTTATTGLTVAQLAQAKVMSEETLTKLVIQTVRAHGLKVAHFRTVQTLRRNGTTRHLTPVQGDGVGFPDLIIAGGVRVEARELKSWTNRQTQEQVMWLDLLAASGAGTGVWTPLEWFSGQIRSEIEAMRQRGAE